MPEHRLRADARANRARLLDAAVAVLAEEGPNADLRRIAERARVSTGTLHRNFPTKEDLVLAMAAEAKAYVRETVRRAVAEEDPLVAIRRLLEGGFAASQRFGLLTALADGPHERRERFRHEDLNEEVLQHVAALVRRAMAAGVLRRDLDVDFTTFRLISLIQPRLVQRYGQRWSVDQLVGLSLDCFLHGAGATTVASHAADANPRHAPLRQGDETSPK